MPDPVISTKPLSEAERAHLDTVVSKMEAAGESEDSIRAVIGDFQQLKTSGKISAEPTFWDNHPYLAHLARGTADTLPAVGAGIGAIAGAPEGGVGAIPGAAAGAFTGRYARDTALQLAGLDKPNGPLDKMPGAVLDAGLSAVTPGGAGLATQAPGVALRLAHKVAEPGVLGAAVGGWHGYNKGGLISGPGLMGGVEGAVEGGVTGATLGPRIFKLLGKVAPEAEGMTAEAAAAKKPVIRVAPGERPSAQTGSGRFDDQPLVVPDEAAARAQDFRNQQAREQARRVGTQYAAGQSKESIMGNKGEISEGAALGLGVGGVTAAAAGGVYQNWDRLKQYFMDKLLGHDDPNNPLR